MADVSKYKIFKNTKFEVLTDQGYKDFKGIIVGENNNKLLLKLSNNKELTCTPKHKIIVDNEYNYVYAKDLNIGDKVYEDIIVTDITTSTSKEQVYEILDVKDIHRYYCNGILSEQCLILDELAFIDNHLVQDFWRSVFPIISSSKKSKIFIASTPNGTDNLFYDLYNNAEKGANGWKAERIDWWEVPGRNDKWKEDTIKALGSMEAFAQEFENKFLQTGESSIDDDLFDKLKLNCREPEFVFEDGKYLMWDEPSPDNTYVVGVDIAEGVGENASVVQILDITDLRSIKQVGVYWDTHISPYKFTTKLYEILQHWGSPCVAIERNNCGAQVVDNILNVHGYTNLVNFSPKKNSSSNYDRLGVIAHTNTKYKGVMNMRYWVNELRCVEFRDINTVKELKDFVRYPNGTWAAKKEQGALDDRVMSLIWSLIVLEESVTEKYFDIIETDDNDRPSKIESIDYGVKSFVNPLSIYSNEKYTGGDNSVSPAYFAGDSSGGETETDLAELESMGWKFLDDGR